MTLRAAIVGTGFMGWIHRLAYARCGEIELAGFCSRDATKRAGDWSTVKGNFGPPGEAFDVAGLTVTETLDELLRDDSIDLIDICLPPHLHCDAVTRAVVAGKKVLCEKPLALNSADARQLLDIAGPGQLMVAHILPWMPPFELLVDAARDRRWGRPISARLQRTIPPPDWIDDFFEPDRVGGPLIDLQIHDAHLARILFGMPAAAQTACHLSEACTEGGSGVPRRYETVLDYPPVSEDESESNLCTVGGGSYVNEHAPVVSLVGGVTQTPGRTFSHGYEVSFENATVRFEYTAYSDGQSDTIPVTVMHADGRVERPELGSDDPIDAFAAQFRAVANATAASMPAALDPVIAADAIQIAEMQMPTDRRGTEGD